jgi:hypothetical protein
MHMSRNLRCTFYVIDEYNYLDICKISQFEREVRQLMSTLSYLCMQVSLPKNKDACEDVKLASDAHWGTHGVEPPLSH